MSWWNRNKKPTEEDLQRAQQQITDDEHFEYVRAADARAKGQPYFAPDWALQGASYPTEKPHEEMIKWGANYRRLAVSEAYQRDRDRPDNDDDQGGVW